MSKFNGKTVLVTGGASGIGKIMGRLALEKGARLIIWDINPQSLESAKTELSKIGQVDTFSVDVSDKEQVHKAANDVIETIGFVDILINNAGIVVGKYFHEHSTAEITKTMDVNSIAPMVVTNEFLPLMVESNSGHICTIASMAGLASNTKMAVYVASKWAALGWSDSLRLEMKYLKKNIKVTTITPYYISTGMFDGVRSILPILKPEKVARKVIRGIERNRPIVSMPLSMRLVRFCQGIMPIGFFDWFMGRVMGIYRTMEHFKGHDSN